MRCIQPCLPVALKVIGLASCATQPHVSDDSEPPELGPIIPALSKAFPGIEDRLATPDDSRWAAEFLRITQEIVDGNKANVGLRGIDLDPLVARAIRGSRGSEEVCLIAAHLRLSSATPELKKLLQNPSPLIRAGALDALVTLGVRQAIPDIVPLLKDSNRRVRVSAVWAIAELSPEDASLRSLDLFGEPDPVARIGIAECLGTLGIEKAIRELLKGLQYSDRFARIEAIQALGRMREARAIPGLIDLLEDENNSIRYEAVRALGRIGNPETIQAIAGRLKDHHGFTRCQAALALARMGAEDRIPEIVSLLRHSFDRLAAIPALVRLNAKTAIPDIRRHLGGERRDSAGMAHWAAIPALAALEDRDAIPYFVALLGEAGIDSAGRVDKVYAIKALGKLKADEAAPSLMKLLKDPWSPARAAVAGALARMEWKEAVPELLKLLDDDKEHVRREVAWALGRLRADASLARYALLARASNFRDRQAAIEMLALLGRERAVPILLRLLGDPDDRIRITAAKWLCDIGVSDGVEILLQESWDLTFLNALRNPAMWNSMPESLRYIGNQESFEERAEKEGVQVDWRPIARCRGRQWTMIGNAMDLRPSQRRKLLIALEGVSTYQRFSTILEKERIRVETRAEALKFWRSWWAEEQKKQPKE